MPIGPTKMPNDRAFALDASVVLVGCRGSGKRTLGFLGGAHLGRRLVAADKYFENVTGLSRAEFLARHGKKRFARQNMDVFKHMLDANRTGCIIECGVASLVPEAQDVLRTFCLTNPVVYVHREPEHVAPFLDPAEAGQLLAVDQTHRTFSNLEYCNLYDSSAPISSGSQSPASVEDGKQHVSKAPMTLLRAREDFASFLDLVTGRSPGIRERERSERPFSLAAIPPESRLISYALRIRLSCLVQPDFVWERLEAHGDCIELIIDTWPDDIFNLLARHVARIRRTLGVPVIYHVEEHPRGERARPQEERDRVDANLLELGLRLGVGYLSVDLQRSKELVDHVFRLRGHSKVIGNYWCRGMDALRWADPQQIENYRRAALLGCDVVRIVRFCTPDGSAEQSDTFKRMVLGDSVLPEGCHKPAVVAYDCSVLGPTTPMQNLILAPIKYPVIPAERDHLVTESRASNLTKTLFEPNHKVLDRLSFYVFGSDVSYSLSPAMHRVAYEFCGMPHTFQVFECSKADGLLGIIWDQSFGGASLAAPFKTATMCDATVKSHHATVIDAVNVLIPLRHGGSGDSNHDASASSPSPSSSSSPQRNKIPLLQCAQARNKAGPIVAFYGDNTDWSAILACLRRAVSPRNSVRPSRTTALVVGAGGMARAAVYALVQMGCRNIFIFNRTASKAQEVATRFNRWAVDKKLFKAAATDGRQEEGGGGGDGEGDCSPGDTGPKVCRVLPSLAGPWPVPFQQPTIVISCIPATANFMMPEHWLQSPTGGVLVELAYDTHLTALATQMRAFQSTSPSWVMVDIMEALSEMASDTFELMTGRPAPRRRMEEKCRRLWEQRRRDGPAPASS